MNHDSAPPGEQASRHSAAQMMTIRADTHTFMDLETFAQGVCAVLSVDLSQMSKNSEAGGGKSKCSGFKLQL